MELTVKQIIDKQRELEKELQERLNRFEEETGLYIKGEIHYGHTNERFQHWLSLNYSNPFL